MDNFAKAIAPLTVVALLAVASVGKVGAADRDDLVREIDTLETRLGTMILRDPGAWAAAATSLGGAGVAIDESLPSEVRVIAGLVGIIAGVACMNDAACRGVVADMIETGRQIDGAKAALAQLDAPAATPREPAPSIPAPRAESPAPSLLAGAIWQPLPNDVAAETRQALVAALAERTWPAGTIGSATALRLPFYQSGWLVRFDATRDDGRIGWYDVVVAGHRTLLVDGTSPGIHELNSLTPVSISTPEAAANYLRFFTESIAAADGPFIIIDTIADMPWAPTAPANVIVDTQNRIVPFSVARSGDGWTAVATVQYGRAIYRAGFRIAPTGMVEMTDDEEIAGELPLVQAVFDQGLRTVQAAK